MFNYARLGRRLKVLTCILLVSTSILFCYDEFETIGDKIGGQWQRSEHTLPCMPCSYSNYNITETLHFEPVDSNGVLNINSTLSGYNEATGPMNVLETNSVAFNYSIYEDSEPKLVHLFYVPDSGTGIYSSLESTSFDLSATFFRGTMSLDGDTLNFGMFLGSPPPDVALDDIKNYQRFYE